MAYIDAAEAMASLSKKCHGESVEKVAKLQRDALAQLGGLKHFSDPSLMLSSFASILMVSSVCFILGCGPYINPLDVSGPEW